MSIALFNFGFKYLNIYQKWHNLTLSRKRRGGVLFRRGLNRTEEAMGSALDLWTAFRLGHFSTPADDLSLERFARVLVAHLTAFV
jgi:hypothetical protein